jgi:hypothetical protein
MTEIEARAALRDFDGTGGVEHWIAGQLWQVEPDGWTLPLDLTGWRFRLRPIPGGLQVSATAPGGERPATWVVPRS